MVLTKILDFISYTRQRALQTSAHFINLLIFPQFVSISVKETIKIYGCLHSLDCHDVSTKALTNKFCDYWLILWYMFQA